MSDDFDDDVADAGNRLDDAFDDDGPSGNRIAGGQAKAVLEYVAGSLVDRPDDVEIEVSESRGHLTLRLHVDPDDMGKVIGRRGRVAQSIRTVVRAAGAAEGVDASVDIVD